jgi:hypothetical protein
MGISTSGAGKLSFGLAAFIGALSAFSSARRRRSSTTRAS